MSFCFALVEKFGFVSYKVSGVLFLLKICTIEGIPTFYFSYMSSSK